MGKFLYSNVMKRWLMMTDAIDDNQTKSVGAFKEGYDDPTYMTFRIEFGDWGASILDRSQISMGVTNFAASKKDYDALPIGLLNCPYEGIDNAYQYWQNNAHNDSEIFNTTTIYSAFQYLRSRNEDTRAKYLYYFVNGLFEIQKDYPYLFKKISGLDSLEAFDPKQGQRLKSDTKITIECFEGLSLKIRTLLELYRKAAWDDVNQKWILPENMRQFKMVIYVFERRTFHDATPLSLDCEETMSFEYSSLNADIPVKAYECCPCEFDIAGSQSWKGEYSADWSGSEESSKISIFVRNVKTYYKNGLLGTALGLQYDSANTGTYQDGTNIDAKISNIMIYDLVEGIERTTGSYGSVYQDDTATTVTNATVSSVRQLFLNKDILLENEDAKYTLKNYIWGKSLGGAFSSQFNTNDINNVVQKNTDALYAKDLPSDGQFSKTLGVKIQDANISTLFPRAGWLSVLVESPSYDSTKSFWSNLGDNIANLLVGARQYVLISGSNFSLSADRWTNIMNSLCQWSPYLSTATEQPGDLLDLLPHSYHARRISNTSFIDRQIPSQNLAVLDPLRTPDPQVLATMLPERPIVDQPLDELGYLRVVPEQEIADILPERNIPDQTLADMGNLRDVPPQDLVSPKDPRDIPPQDINDLGDPRNVPDQDLAEPSDPREIPDQDMATIDPLREVPNQDLQGPSDLREIPDQVLSEPGPGRDVPNQNVNNLGDLRNVPEQNLTEMGDTRDVPNNLQEILMIARTLPGFENVKLDDIRDIPELKLQNLKDEVDKAKPIYKINSLELLDTISKATEQENPQLVELDKEQVEIENKTIQSLKDAMNLSDIAINETDKSKKESILNFTKLFSENSQTVKDLFVENIDNMRTRLNDLTTQAIRELPKLDTVVIKNNEDKQDIDKDSLISLTDMEQIDKNIPLLSIKKEDLRELSFSTLIKLNSELEERIQQTQPLVGLTKIVKDSDDKQKIVNQPLKDTKKSKERKLLGLLPPREIDRNRQIIY